MTWTARSNVHLVSWWLQGEEITYILFHEIQFEEHLESRHLHCKTGKECATHGMSPMSLCKGHGRHLRATPCSVSILFCGCLAGSVKLQFKLITVHINPFASVVIWAPLNYKGLGWGPAVCSSTCLEIWIKHICNNRIPLKNKTYECMRWVWIRGCAQACEIINYRQLHYCN